MEKNELSSKYDQYYKNIAEGAQIRSRVKWVEEGEKNTKYFLNLEQKHQTNNRISSIKLSDGKHVYKSEDILNEGAKFYRKLYSKASISVDDIDSYLENINPDYVLSEIEASVCEGLITEKDNYG